MELYRFTEVVEEGGGAKTAAVVTAKVEICRGGVAVLRFLLQSALMRSYSCRNIA